MQIFLKILALLNSNSMCSRISLTVMKSSQNVYNYFSCGVRRRYYIAL